ncbi:MAG: glycosyltransferase family 4 protein [Bacteroides sp.]|nr:glycosyltransferase family 4 protein [Bacteroides sp.]MBD5418884.1 glycosyltransferase family 4 protein [Bacteroides sp.]
MMKKGKETDKRGRLIIAVNEDTFFLSHRVSVAEAAKDAGMEVIVTCSDTGHASEIILRGFIYEPMPIAPRSLSPMDEWRVIRFLASLIRKYPDSILHFVGMKLILAGNIAVRLTPSPRGIVNAVSGLGILFMNPSGKMQKLLFSVLRLAKNRKIPTRTIFQNFEDQEVFRKAGLIGNNEAAYIKGSGVSLEQFHPAENKEKRTLASASPCDTSSDDSPSDASPSDVSPSESSRNMIVLFAGRLLKSKGVEDIISAAELLRPKWEGRVEFRICGGLSSKINAITKEEMETLTDGRYVKWLGNRSDMDILMQEADIMVYPSYYREGVPRVLLEASASGLPIITCDSVGCRDTVEDGVNGFLVPPQSPAQIAEKIDRLLSDTPLRVRMGKESRRIAIRDYSLTDVVRAHLAIYTSLLD